MKSKNNLLRVLRTPEDEILLDATGRKNGRGAYLCISSECLAKAKKKKALERSLKAEISNDIYDLLAEQMREAEAAMARQAEKGDGNRIE